MSTTLQENDFPCHERLSKWASNEIYHARTLWLFTANDIYTFTPSQVINGAIITLTGQHVLTVPSPSPYQLLLRLPLMFLYVWSNVLVINIANQRLPDAMLEDAKNKPWRPLPSHRLTEDQARQWLHVTIPAVLATSFCLGGLEQTVIYIILVWLYNDLGGAKHLLLRDLYNCLGITCYALGAASVACQSSGFSVISPSGWIWFGILGAVIASTVHLQDLRDMEGDAAIGRKTLPLVFGDKLDRYVLSLCITLWSFVCPAWWGVGVFGYILPVAFGLLISLRILFLRNVAADRLSFHLWPLWMITLYMIPLGVLPTRA